MLESSLQTWLNCREAFRFYEKDPAERSITMTEKKASSSLVYSRRMVSFTRDRALPGAVDHKRCAKSRVSLYEAPRCFFAVV